MDGEGDFLQFGIVEFRLTDADTAYVISITPITRKHCVFLLCVQGKILVELKFGGVLAEGISSMAYSKLGGPLQFNHNE